MEKICKGCGEVLQTIDETKPGYINEALLERDEDLYCQRCFKLLHYGKFEHIDIDQRQFDSLFNNLSKKSLIIYVLDIFNLEGSKIEDLEDKIKNNDCLLVINKIDLLPRSLKASRIKEFIGNSFKNSKLNIKKIILISSKKKYGIDDVLDFLKKNTYKDAYVLGKSNSGKSTFISSLTKALGLNSSKLVSSFYPGTTLKIVEVPLDFIKIYDTPGFESTNSIYDYLNLKNLKKVIPLQEIKPISMTIYPGTSLFIGSSCKIDFELDHKINAIAYGSNLLKYHHTKLEGSNEKFDQLISDKTLVPKLDNSPKLETFKVTKLKVNEDRISLVINGLCIIDLLKTKGNINVYCVDNVGVSLQKSIFGGHKNVNTNK